MNTYKYCLSAGAMALLLAAQPASAYVMGWSDFNSGNKLTLDGNDVSNTDSGWYLGAYHSPDNTNYIVAEAGDPDLFNSDPYNNFFVFDISNLSGPVTSASFTVFASVVTTSETYTLFDFSGSVSDLIAGTGGLAAFNDLGSGTSYGSRGYTSTDSNAFHTIALNSDFIDDLNSAIRNQEQFFVVGGAVSPGSVPEPASLALLGIGLAGLGAMRRRKTA